MSALLPFVQIDSSSLLARYFTPYQIAWIEAEEPFHAAKKQVFALAEKSVRIGWTFCDGFKNVRKRLRFKNRDYLFVTKDWPSALEYMNQVYQFAEVLGFTRAVLNHGEDVLKVPLLDPAGHRTSLTEEVKIGYIKFDNGSRIIAFSSNPYATAVYGGDVGLDEFAKHPNAELLWQTAQARVTWNCDLALWSSHDGMDTLFNTFAQQARLLASGSSSSSSSFSSSSSPAPSLNGPPSADSRSDAPRSDALTLSPSDAPRPSGPWNLYFRVTMPDAVEGGLLDVINRTTDANFTPAQFLADCRARAGSEEIFQQSYMCNPMGAASSHIVEASALEHCRADYQIIRAHFEQDQIHQQFGAFRPDTQAEREYEIGEFINKKFLPLFQGKQTYRLGFDVAASGQGSLAAIYIDEVKGSELWLRALFTCRTEDWNFLYTVLATFLRSLRYVRAAGDQTGLGRQICWDAAKRFPGRFTSVNFSSKKHDIGFALMNQLATAQKRFPRCEQDIGADYFALRKIHEAGRWVFTEGPNALNPASHCDIAWAGGLATEAHTANQCSAGARLC